MKASVTVPDEDIEFLDNYAKTHHVASRSGALQKAIRLLRQSRPVVGAAPFEIMDQLDDALRLHLGL